MTKSSAFCSLWQKINSARAYDRRDGLGCLVDSLQYEGGHRTQSLQCKRSQDLKLVGEEEADFLFVGLDAQGTARLKPFPLCLSVAGA